jgi:hypothetical protein
MTPPRPPNPDMDLPAASTSEDEAALRDAQAILARATADEEAATSAKEQYRRAGLPAIEPDDWVREHLRHEELLHAHREAAILNSPSSNPPLPGYAGRLYLTSQRVLHIGQMVVSLALEDIDELALAGERLLVTLTNGEGLSLDVGHPRLLRVQIGAARTARR